MKPAPEVREEKFRILEDVFGFQSFRPGQEAVVDAILSGHDVLAVMPTGAGKSLCFQIPALGRGGLAVIVSPLIALMQDQVSALNLAGVRAESINSSRERADNVATWRRVAAGKVDLLYMSPERLMTEQMLEALAAGRPTVITPQGHAGINAVAGQEYVVAATPDAFAEAVNDLLTDHPRCLKFSERAIAFVRERYDVSVLMPRFGGLLLGEEHLLKTAS